MPVSKIRDRRMEVEDVRKKFGRIPPVAGDPLPRVRYSSINAHDMAVTRRPSDFNEPFEAGPGVVS